MKRFLKKRWLGLPIGIITVVLLVLMLAGTALAVNGYVFFEGTAEIEVREAIAVGAFDTWDNLHPYGSDEAAEWVYDGGSWVSGTLGDVVISLGADPTVSIKHVGSGDTVGSGFCPGEWIVIPLNIRNGSSGALDLGVYGSAPGLVLEYAWAHNGVGDNFKVSGSNLELWKPLGDFFATIKGYGGESGSAVIGAQVLFIKISVPQVAIPGDDYTATFKLTRGVTPK